MQDYLNDIKVLMSKKMIFNKTKTINCKEPKGWNSYFIIPQEISKK